MKMSPEIGELAKALVKAQAEMGTAAKDASNPFFKSSYTTFSALVDALREPFAANGLAFMQIPGVSATDGLIIETMILHTSGQWISGEQTGRPVKDDPQGVGSLMSYMKRYGLQAMAGIPSKDEDDDGNHASGKVQAPMRKSAPKQQPLPPDPDAATKPITAKVYSESRRQLAHEIKRDNDAKQEPFEIPFGANGHDEVYTETNAQKKMLEKDAAFAGIKDIPTLRALSAAMKDCGIFVADLPRGIQDWIKETGWKAP